MVVKRLITAFSFCVGVGLLLLPIAVQAEAVVAQTYGAKEQYEAGTVVSREDSNSTQLTKADTENRANLTGVVIARDASLLTYNLPAGSLQVATSGAVPANVSTVNGEIKAGDQLTASPIAGFAMKATAPSKIIGRALADFSAKTNGAQIRSVNDSRGKPVEVAIGQVQVNVALADWAGTAGAANPLVENLQNVASQVSGKQVSPANAIIAALILSVSILVSGIVLFSSVTSSIHALGRNPLSHSVIRRSLTQVILIVVALMIASVIVVYLIIGR